MKTTITAPKGTKDIFMPEMAKWHYLENSFRAHFQKFFYQEIRTPIFEHSELFSRGIGDATEVVQKEMYTFLDKGDRSITLRPENTASVARALIEGKLFNQHFPLRYYYIGPMFRYEKPQKGRQRQFHQVGIEVFGDDSPGIDAEVIYAASSFLESIGIQKLSLWINSVGCPECRPAYLDLIRAEAGKSIESLCTDCQRKVETNPLRIFDCKKERCNLTSSEFSKITDHLCDSCDRHFSEVVAFLDELGVAFEINPRMVRGLDYYTKTAFEITSDQLGSQDAVLGGGRYNNLVSELGGPEVSGIGFAAGMERIIHHLESIPHDEPVKILVAYQSPDLEKTAVSVAKRLWAAGHPTYINYQARHLKKQFKKGDRLQVGYTVILGEEESRNRVLSIKNMETKSQIEIPEGELEEWLNKQQ